MQTKRLQRSSRGQNKCRRRRKKLESIDFHFVVILERIASLGRSSQLRVEEEKDKTDQHRFLDEPNSVLPFLRADLLERNVDSRFRDSLLVLESRIDRVAELRLCFL